MRSGRPIEAVDAQLDRLLRADRAAKGKHQLRSERANTRVQANNDHESHKLELGAQAAHRGRVLLGPRVVRHRAAVERLL